MIQSIFKKYGRSSFRCGVGEILGGVSSVMTPIFGGVADAQNVADSNAARIRMQRETNQMNYKMFHEAQDFQEKMWNQTNEYNSPEQIAERLRGIGVNPLKVLAGDGASMQTAGLTGSPSAVPASSPSIESYQGNSIASQGIQRAISDYFQNAETDADTKLKLVDLSFRAQEHRSQLEDKKADIDLKLQNQKLSAAERTHLLKQAEQLEQQISYFDTVFDDVVKQQHLNTQLLGESWQSKREETTSLRLQNEYQETLNKWTDKMSAQQLQLLKAQTASAYNDANLKKQMTRTEVHRTAQEITNSQIALMRKMSFNVDKNLERELLRANIAQINAVTHKTSASDNWLQNYSPFGSIMIGGAAIMKAVPK